MTLDRKDKKPWVPPDPSMAQLRAAITEYCVLPLGSPNVKAKLEGELDVKSIMFYGPSGAGKTMMVEAVANELGAMLINISPERLKEATEFADKKLGAARLCQIIYKIAREDPEVFPTGNPHGPVVVYMDECEQFFAGGGKKAKVDKSGPIRFKKDITIYKNQGFKHNDRVIFIGCTSTPEKADKKDLKAFFDKFLYMPYPDYASRLMLWRQFVSMQLSLAGSGPGSSFQSRPLLAEIPDEFDLSTLARISYGFSAGAICRCVKKTLTKSRVDRLDKRALTEDEFVNSLALEASKRQANYTYAEDLERFNEFTAKITDLEERRQLIEDEKAEGKDGGDKKGKGKKGKKGKKK